uniref:Uncharacterized protein n=1 Tax=Craspedostauros australis TaxID=1486917 RepID=A0A7R9ZS39_9STRA
MHPNLSTNFGEATRRCPAPPKAPVVIGACMFCKIQHTGRVPYTIARPRLPYSYRQDECFRVCLSLLLLTQIQTPAPRPTLKRMHTFAHDVRQSRHCQNM